MIILFSIFLIVFSIVIIKYTFSEIKKKLRSSKWVAVEGVLDNVKKWKKTTSHTGAYAASVSTKKYYISFRYSYEVNKKNIMAIYITLQNIHIILEERGKLKVFIKNSVH
ncbi:MAG: hypothetical protein D3904_13360 [Candidatus Electrothrix sp. EH2]|nr:hypothetical protein [Candidatus Electrothrix sp. EH2]